MRLIGYWFLAFFVCLSRALAADGYSLPGTETHQIPSTVFDEPMTIAVALPNGYDPTSTYPLLFSLDGDAMFGMATEVPRLLAFEGKVPPMIVATVIYGDFGRWIRGRMRDYHPAHGGADRFLAALEADVLPFLHRTYRLEADRQLLYGHSSGGLFAYYTGLKAPTLFTHILATSPSLEEEPEWTADFLGLIHQNTTGFPAFYLAADASEAATISALQPSVALLRSQSVGQRLAFETLSEGSHMAVIPKAFTAGLHFLFVR